MLVLDSDFLIECLRGTESALLALTEFRSLSKPLATTAVNVSEILLGEKLFGSPSSYNKAREFLQEFGVLSFDGNAAESLAALEADLRKKGTPMGVKDEIIAAIVLVFDAELVTRNQKHFARVKGLKMRKW